MDRLYTLKKVTAAGKVAKSAHPGEFFTPARADV